MIARAAVEAVGKRIGFTAGQAEKDYLQHLLLSAIAERTKRELVFKGGTALQKTFGLPRYSEDLDFTKQGEIDVEALLQSVAAAAGKAGYPATVKRARGIGENFRLLIQGPLFVGSPQSAASIRVEVSLRKDLLREPVARDVTPLYPDTLPYTLLVMDLEEILAEKVRALLSREKARDLYDLWFLLQKGVRFDRELAERKAELEGETFTLAAFAKRVAARGAIWEKELRQLTKFLPAHAEVVKAVLAAVR